MRDVPFVLRTLGVLLLLVGLAGTAAAVFIKAAFTHIGCVTFNYRLPDGTAESTSTTVAASSFHREVADQSDVAIYVYMNKSASKLQVRWYLNGGYQGILVEWSSPKAGQTYSTVKKVAGVGNTYEFDVICYWDGTDHGEMCSGIFDVKAPPGPTTRTLNICATSGGTTDPKPGTYTYTEGSEVRIVAAPDSGYQFAGWSGDVSGVQNPLTLTMNRDYSVTANFSRLPTTYTLTTSVSPPGSGSVSPSGGTYNAGAQVTLTATPASGYRFDHWEGSASGTGNPVTITMDSNKSVTACFVYATAPSTTFKINGHTVTPSTMLYLGTTSMQFVLTSDKNLSGAKVTISGTANATIDLAPFNIPTQWVGSWTAPGEGRYTITCTASYPGGTVTAAHLEVAYGEIAAPPGKTALVFSIAGQGSVVVTEPEGKTVVDENTVVRVQAFPEPGWRFKAWGGDVAGLGRGPCLSFVATGNSMMIVAEFEREVPLAERAVGLLRDNLFRMMAAAGLTMVVSGEVLERRRR